MDAMRWMRLNRSVFKTEKVDLLAEPGQLALVPELIKYGREIQLAVSLRTACAGPVPDLKAWKAAGLWDVFLTPRTTSDKVFPVWLEACKAAGLPVRVQVQLPLEKSEDPSVWARRFKECGVVAVHVTPYDAFVETADGADRSDSQVALDAMVAWVLALDAEDIEANLLHIPFALVPEAVRPHCVSGQLVAWDHQLYNERSYQIARAVARRPASIGGLIVMLLLSQFTLHRNRIDTWLLPWLMRNPWAYARVAALRKITRYTGWLTRRPRAVSSPTQGLAKPDTDRTRTPQQPDADAVFGHGDSEERKALARALPGLSIPEVSGEDRIKARHYAAMQRKYYDSIDAQRIDFHADANRLAKIANDLTTNTEPTQEILPMDFGIEDTSFDPMEGGVRWHAMTGGEKVSWPLPTLEPPFTISVGFGGGIAEYIGFSFGRHCKLLTPMEGYRHVLTLHVEADGHYVLLCDGKPVRPVEFEGLHYAPLRLAGRLTPRLSCWNIDGAIVTQMVKIWHGRNEATGDARPIKYSLIVVTTKYARRLQAVMQSIAHQRDFALAQIEIVVCYVPGVDATDDLLDSMNAVYPSLRILRSPFPEQNTKSKGFMINESILMASGEWIVMLDSDILLHPETFKRIDEVAKEGVVFIAPDGRKMLSREATARVLLGEWKPWEHWDTLLADAGEYRYREALGIPIGYLQVVRASCLEKIRYTEVDHFEGADMWFGEQLRQAYGKETRLSGLPVLHLDHGGSQWYGTTKHF